MSQINVKNLSNENEDGAPEIANISDFSATSYMCPPKGTTAQRPLSANPGDLRFNTDTASLEYYKGNTLGWTQIEMTSPDLDGSVRGIKMGGGYPNGTDETNYLNVSTLGFTADFGNLTFSGGRLANACFASRTHAFAAGGGTFPGNTYQNTIQNHEFASTGNFNDFGDLSSIRNEMSNLSNSTRGVLGLGYPGVNNGIEYITMSSSGDSVDFGDRSTNSVGAGTMQSSTRGVFSSGEIYVAPAYAITNVMQYVTISTLGDTKDFGDAARGVRYPAATSNSVRGVQALGGSPNTFTNAIEYITMTTLGNALDFGDLVASNIGYGAGAFASPTRAVFSVGNNTDTDYVQIMTTGNAVDWGDLRDDEGGGSGGCSNGHGGL